MAMMGMAYEFLVFVIEPLRTIFKVKISGIKLMSIVGNNTVRSGEILQELLRNAVVRGVESSYVNDIIVGDLNEPLHVDKVIIRDIPDLESMQRILPKDWIENPPKYTLTIEG